MGRSRVALAVAASLVTVAGCASGQSGDASVEGNSKTPGAVQRHCNSSLQSIGFWDHAAGAKGFPTPRQAVKPLMTAKAADHYDQLRMIHRDRRPALAFISHDDGTLRAKLTIVRTSSGGWLVSSGVYCH